jgi:hypothetical protein
VNALLSIQNIRFVQQADQRWIGDSSIALFRAFQSISFIVK